MRAVGFFAGRDAPSCHARPRSGIQSKEFVFRDSGQPIPCHPWAWPEDPGQRILIFGGMSKVSKSGIHAAWILAYARMTAGGGVAVRDNLSRTVVPLCRHPLSLTRGSRAIIPYFSEVSMSIKAVSMLPGCSPAQGGHPPPPVMPDPDRASRAKSPFSAIADNPFHVILGLGPRIQGNNSLFWRDVKGL